MTDCAQLAVENDARILLLTEKDAVKWEEMDVPKIKDLEIAKLETVLNFNPQLPRIYDLALSRFS